MVLKWVNISNFAVLIQGRIQIRPHVVQEVGGSNPLIQTIPKGLKLQ